MDLSRVAAQDVEHGTVDADLLAAMRYTTEAVCDQPADRIDFVVAVARAEHLVELGDLGQRAYAVCAIGRGDDVVFFLIEVVFVLDVADDLLEHILDRDEARNTAVLVDDDRDV